MGSNEHSWPHKNSQKGISLLEILIAVSLLGVAFTAVFTGLSTALRTIDRVAQYNRAVDFALLKMNQVLLDPTLQPGFQRLGEFSSGETWAARAELVEERPGATANQRVQLLRVAVEVRWKLSRGEQRFALQTLKLRMARAETGS